MIEDSKIYIKIISEDNSYTLDKHVERFSIEHDIISATTISNLVLDEYNMRHEQYTTTILYKK